MYRAPANRPDSKMMAMDRGTVSVVRDATSGDDNHESNHSNIFLLQDRYQTEPFLTFRSEQVLNLRMQGVEHPVTGLRKAKVTVTMRESVDANRNIEEVFIFKMGVADGEKMSELIVSSY